VAEISQKSKDANLTFINLIVHWKDIEPKDNQFEFWKLSSLISEIKFHDLQCVLRIYFNAGEFSQASPDWLFNKGAKFYYSGAFKQPLPWDTTYQAEIDELLNNLSSYFSTSKIYPDAFQASVGGDFGEQWLSYNWTQYGSRNDYLTFLFENEKWHIRKFYEYFGSELDLIVMVNKMTEPDDPNFSAVLDEAFKFGYKWVQSNASSQRLQSCNYSEGMITMIKKYAASGSMFFMLEEESGRNSYSADATCPSLTGEDISVRVDRVKQLEIDNGLRVRGIMINRYDLDSSQQSLDKLVNHFYQ
jgi:hypothetical protein